MEPAPHRARVLAVRWSDLRDCAPLAEVHAAAWRYAYAGVIAEPGLSRMISRRGPAWWSRVHSTGGRALVAEFGGAVVGYVLLGRCRSGSGGELYELYVRPECHGLGFGSRLFATARAELRARDVAPLTVWCLADNRIGVGFYRSLGGEVSGSADERVAGSILKKLRFTWA